MIRCDASMGWRRNQMLWNNLPQERERERERETFRRRWSLWQISECVARCLAKPSEEENGRSDAFKLRENLLKSGRLNPMDALRCISHIKNVSVPQQRLANKQTDYWWAFWWKLQQLTRCTLPAFHQETFMHHRNVRASLQSTQGSAGSFWFVHKFGSFTNYDAHNVPGLWTDQLSRRVPNR